MVIGSKPLWPAKSLPPKPKPPALGWLVYTDGLPKEILENAKTMLPFMILLPYFII